MDDPRQHRNERLERFLDEAWEIHNESWWRRDVWFILFSVTWTLFVIGLRFWLGE